MPRVECPESDVGLNLMTLDHDLSGNQMLNQLNQTFNQLSHPCAAKHGISSKHSVSLLESPFPFLQ